MNEQIDFVKKILDYISEYIEISGKNDLKEFSIFFRDKLMKGEKPKVQTNFNKNTYSAYKTYPEVEFSTLVSSLFKFAKGYIKKAFANKEIKTIDEFGFLASLLLEKSMMKNELIDKHLLEMSSGSEVLKRLLRKGLIREFADKHDRRGKRVSLTETGKKAVMETFDEMHKVSKIVIGNISEEELITTLSVLNKLNYFHLKIHKNHKNSTLDKITEIYLN